MSQEQKFQAFAYLLNSRGLTARFANDRLPDHTYITLMNAEVKMEGAMSVRFGRFPLTVNGEINSPLAGSVNTLGRLKSLSQTFRYASAGGNLYRIAGDAPGVWSQIYTGLSTQRGSMVTYTPPFSSYPYLFIADNNLMLEDNGGVTPPTVTGRWGILWPQQPMYAVEQDASGVYDVPIADSGYTYSSVASHSFSTPVSTTANGTVLPGQLSSLTVASITGISLNSFVLISGQSNPVQVQQITNTDTIWFQANALSQYALTVQRGIIEFVTSGASSYFESTFGGGTFDFQPPSLQPVTNIVLRVNVHNPSDLTTLAIKLSTGDTTFTNGYSFTYPASVFNTNAETVLILPIADLVPVGTPNIHQVMAFRLVTAQTSAVTIDYYSLNLDFGQGPTILGGSPYDYLYTFFNANTGEESGPSPFMLPNGLYPPVSLFYGPIQVTWGLAPVDSRTTHIRIYRRGGTLPSAFYLIAQLSRLTSPQSVYDNTPDSIASTGSILNIDNYPPITSTLPSPVNTTFAQAATAVLETYTSVYPASMVNISVNQRITLGTGLTQETVVVASVASDHFTAFLEFNHAVGETIYAEAAWAQPARGAQIGFDRLFVYGDENNPGRLYYSNVGQPSSFGVENFIDMDDPSDPIMGVTPAVFGRMYCFTLGGAVYQIISVNGSIPIQTKTNATHGMFSFNAFTLLDQGVPYYSNDGVYLFTGGTSAEVSQLLQWIFREYTEANAPYGGLVPLMDLTKRDQVCFGFYWDEAFVSYVAVNGSRYRVVYSARDNRWRLDDEPASSMLYEKDTASLIFGTDNGLVFQDRTGDQDLLNPTTPVPIGFVLLTAALDQGQPHNPKVYTEFAIDINTNGQDVQCLLLANNATVVADTLIVNTPSRQQVQFKILAGLGFSSLNVAFQIAVAATANVDIYELHLKALVDAELRKTFDTFQTKYGSEQYKLAKQGYFEYTSTAPIVVGCYQEGNLTAPVFTFTLPSTGGQREIIWIRFPATKAKSFRWAGACDDDFQIYENSFIEVKILGVPKGYTPQPLVM